MKYMSSRGGESGLSFQDVLFAGYAKDGGLYFPEVIPRLSSDLLETWRGLSYPAVLQRILALFISEAEVPSADLGRLVEAAFTAFKDPHQPVHLAKLAKGLNIAELFHGPTLAFKDLGLGLVGQLYGYFLSRCGKHKTILIGTSGDTGSAAIHAVRGNEWIDIVVLLPKGRCTAVQELQMTTVLDANVHNFAVEGTSDELDVPIKKVFGDSSYVEEHALCSINSINWARVLVQIAHFVYLYLQLSSRGEERVRVVVPTGACGNIAAGYVAYEMGIPLELVAAVNPNDIVYRMLSTGDFSLSEQVHQSWATAMDIQVPYNVERIVLMASGLDRGRVRDLMRQFEIESKVEMPPDIWHQIRKVIVDTCSVDNNTMIESMARCYKENSYTLCPHTAVGVAYIYAQETSTSQPQVVLATASPAKFPEAVTQAGIHMDMDPHIKKLFSMKTRYEWMREGEGWEQILRSKIEEISNQRAKSKNV